MNTLEWIHSFDRFNGTSGIKPGLQRMEAMLERLGNPHHDLRFLHVAGTNGKGSTCAYLAAILEAAGYAAGLFTSPYLTAFHDRMGARGENISPRELDELAARLRPVVEEVAQVPDCGRPTEFEVITALSILFYRARQVDVVVWETGLGGRLDSTNVVTPLLSLITNVGHDHAAILGDSIEEIAAEKAGIIKPGVGVVTTAAGTALDVIERTADEQGAPLQVLGRDFEAERTAFGLDGQTFDWRGAGGHPRFRALRLRMLGAHQVTNASLAVAACVELRNLGFEIPEEAVRRGLEATSWAGRLEIVGQEPLLLLDGAHNPEGAQALRAALEELLPNRRLVFVIGILADKAVPETLGPLVSLADEVFTTAPDLPRAAHADDVAMVIRDLVPQVPVTACTSVDAALRAARKAASGPGDAVIVTGTLFLISEARALLVSECK